MEIEESIVKIDYYLGWSKVTTAAVDIVGGARLNKARCRLCVTGVCLKESGLSLDRAAWRYDR